MTEAIQASGVASAITLSSNRLLFKTGLELINARYVGGPSF